MPDEVGAMGAGIAAVWVATLRPRLRILFGIVRAFVGLAPEPVTRAVDEYVFQSRLADGDGLNLAGECLDDRGDDAMAVLHLETHVSSENASRHAKTTSNALGECSCVAGGFQQDHIATDFLAQLQRSAQG